MCKIEGAIYEIGLLRYVGVQMRFFFIFCYKL